MLQLKLPKIPHSFLFRGLTTILFLAISLSGFAEANYVYHEATTNNPGCGVNNFRSVLTPNSSQSLTIAWRIEYQFYTTSTWVYYTTDGSNPSGSDGVGTGTTQVINGSYSCVFGTPVRDIGTATIPAFPAGTTVKYIVSAKHSGGGDEIWANGPGAPCACGPVTNNASLATVFSYTVTASANVVEVYATGGSAYGNYTTLNAAFTAINAGTHTGAIQISINANTTEPSTAVPLLKSAAPSNYSSILIRPAGNRVINSAAAPSGSRGVIELYGADNITIDGDDPATPGIRNLTIQVVTSGTTGIAAIRLASNSTSGTDGANNNTVKNCIITGSRNSATSTTVNYGINMSNNTAITTGAYSSLNTRIENNLITRCYHGIYANGASTTYPNTGTVIKGNELGSATSASNIGSKGVYITYSSTTPGTGSAIIEENDIRVGDYGATGYALTIAGIEVGTVNAGCKISGNNIHDINQPHTSGYGAHGIYVTGAASNSGITIINNFIRDCKMYIYQTSYTSASTPSGVFFSAGATNVVFNHNTIVMNGQLASSSVFSSFCINSSVSGVTFSQFLNNILVNNHASTGAHCFAVNTPANISNAVVNNNNYYAATTANIGYYNGSVRTTLADWQAATAKDDNAINENPTFVSATDLHINTSIATLLESGGTLTTIITDYDGDSRNCPTDIGADEFIGTNPNGPSIPMSYISSTASQAVASACSGGSVNKEIIRLEIVTDANTGCPITLNNLVINGLGTTTYGEVTSGKIFYTGTSSTFNAANLIGTFPVNGSNQTVTPGSTVTLLNGTNYLWVAYDISPAPVGPDFDAQWISASINVNQIPQTIIPSVTNPIGSVGILPPMSGTYTVGTGGNYTTLTSALDDVVCRGISAATTLSLINDFSTHYDAVHGEVFPYIITNPSGGSITNKVTIKPATGVNPVISGASTTAIFVFNDADYFIIDGSNTIGGSSRNLSIINTSSAANTATIWLSSNVSAGANRGCRNNTIKNTNLSCGIDQSLSTGLTFGVIASGSLISTANTGLYNNSNIIQNDSIIGVRYGVFMNGNSPTLNTDNTITQCKIGAAGFGPASGQIGQAGIVVFNQSNGVITDNEIKYVGSVFSDAASGADRVGIGIGSVGWTPSSVAVNNFVVTGNIIHHIKDEKGNAAIGIIVAGTGTPSNNLIVNNSIYDILSNGTAIDQAVGIGIGAGNGDIIAFNTIQMSGDLDPPGTASATLSAAGIRVVTTTPTNLTVKNNLISVDINSNTGTLNHYAIVLPSSSYAFGTGGLDYNDYYTNASNPQMQLGGVGISIPYTPINDLSTWQTTLSPPQDANSVDIEPTFVSLVSPIDLHLLKVGGINCTLKGIGTPIAGITTDIDGDSRDATQPGMGADEYGGSIPTTPTTSDPSAACVGTQVTVTGSGSTGAVSYGFYDAASGSSQINTSANGTISPTNYVTNTNLGVGVYHVFLEGADAGGCVSPSRKDVTITINALPVVTWTGTLSAQCVSSNTLTLTGTAESPTGGTFSGAGVTGNNFDASVAGVGSHTLTYTYTDGNGCAASATNTVVVNALPVVTWTGTLSAQCVSSNTLTLTGTAESPTGGTFSGAGVTGNNFDASVAGVGSHTLTYTYTDGNGCAASATNTVVVNALPVVTWTGTLSAQCVSSNTLTLTGTAESPTGGTFSGAGVTGSNFDASVAGVGSHTLTYTYTDGNGCAASTTNTVVVNALPVVTWTGTLSAQCVSSNTLTLTGTAESPTGGTFSGAGVTGSNFDASLAGVGSHTLTYTYTDGNGCAASATNTVVVNALPVVTWTGTLSAQCVSSNTLTLTGTAESPTGGTFSGAGVTGSNFDASLAGVGSHTLTYTYTDGNGCAASATNTVVVNALPVVTWTGTLSAQCVSSNTLTLTGTAESPTGGTFSGAGVTGSNFDASVAGVGSHTLTYTYTDGNGCAASATNTVVVNALPVVTWTGTLPAQCVSSNTLTLTGTAESPTGGTFSGAGVTGSNFDASLAGVGSHTLTYTYTDGNGCAASATNTVVVNALPIVTWTGTLSAQCVSSNTLTLTGTAESPTGGTFSGAGVTGSNFDASVAGVGSHTLTYTYTDGNGCAASTTNTVVVNALPVVTWTGTLSAQCVSSNTLTLTGTAESPTGGTFSGAGVTGSNFDASLAGVGSHTLTYTYTDGNGCAASATNTVVVNALPVVTWTGTLSAQCVSSNTLTLTGTAESPTGGTFSGAGVTGSNFDASVAGVGSHTLTYTYTDGNGCAASATNTVVVNALPVVTWTGTLPAQCVSSNTLTLTGTAESPTGGTFSGAGVTGSNFYASLAGVGSHTLTYTYTDGNGCAASATNTVVVNALPIVTWTGTLSAQCVSSNTLTLTGTAESPTGGTFSGAGVTGSNFDASVAGVGSHTLTYTYTDGNGCAASATNTVVVNALPVVTWTGTLSAQCVSSNTLTLTGTAESPTGGTFSGAGVTGSNFDASVAGVGSHTLTYTYTDGNGCAASATNTVVVNALPIVTWTGTLSAQCVSSNTLTLTGTAESPTGGTFSGAGVTGSNFDASLASVGSHTLTYTYTDGNGCAASATNTVVVNALPVVTWTGTLSAQCVSSNTLTLTGTAESPTGGTFSGAGVTGSNFDASLAGVGSHTLTYTYTDGNGCAASATNTVVVNALPIVTWTGTLSAQCVSSNTLTLTGTAESPTGGTFSGAGVTGSNFDASVAGVGSHTLTYTYTDGNGCAASATNTVVVNALPVVTWTGTLPAQCVSSNTLTLTGTAESPTGGTFSGAGVTGSNFDASLAGVGSHTLTYTYTDGNGCAASATNTVVVNALPVVTWTGTLSAQCVSSNTLTLTGTAESPTGGTFSGAGVTGSNFDASVAGVGSHTLTYTYTDGSGCAASATNTVVVNALPVVTWTGTLSAQCVSSNTLTLTGTAESPTGGTFSGAGVTGSNFDASLAGVGSHTLTYTYTDGNGCAASATNTVVVNALPIVTWTGTLSAQCVSSNTLTLTGTAESPTGGTFSGAGVTGSNFDASLAGVGSHTLTYTYTDGNGCAASTTNTVVVNALPVVTWTGTLSAQCVSSNTLTLTGTAESPTGGTFSGAGVTGSNFYASLAGVGSHTLTYTYTDGNGCAASATNTVVVNALPIVTWTGTLSAQCVSSNTLTLTGTAESPTGGTFSGAGVTGSNFDASVAGVGSHTLTYTYTDGNGCAASATNTVNVAGFPSVTASANTPLCIGGTLMLNANSNQSGTYSWTGPNGYTSNMQNPTGITNASAALNGTYTIDFIGDISGCDGSANVNVLVEPFSLQVSPDLVDSTMAHTIITHCTPNYTLYWRTLIASSWSSMGSMTNNPDLTGLQPATAYVAYAVDANGSTTSMVYFTTGGTPFCGNAPTLTATQSCGKIYLDWSTGILYSNYVVNYRKITPSFGGLSGNYTTATDHVFTIAPANLGQTYEVSVAGMCGNQYSIRSVPIHIAVPDPRPAAPTGLVFSATCNSITTTWNAVPGAVGYRVRIKNPITGTTLTNFYTAGVTYTKVGLPSNFTYEIYVVPIGCNNLVGTESQHFTVQTCTGNVVGLVRLDTPDPGLLDDTEMDTDIMTDVTLSIYPNPNHGAFTISANLTDASVLVEVVNMLGQVIYTQNVATENGVLNHEIKLSEGNTLGTYLVRVASSHGVFISKFVKF